MAAAPLILTAVAAAAAVAGGVAADRQAKDQARQARRIGQAKIQDQQRQARRDRAEQQAKFAKAGVSVQSGTPLDILGDTASEQALAALRIRYSADSQSDALKLRGTQALVSGITSGAGTLLGGVADGQAGFLAPKQQQTYDRSRSNW